MCGSISEPACADLRISVLPVPPLLAAAALAEHRFVPGEMVPFPRALQ